MSRRVSRQLPAAAALALLLSATALAQRSERDRDTWTTSPNSADVSGEVRLSGDLTPAQNVAVRLERFGGGVIEQMTTDSRGRFRFANLARAQYVVSVSARCYQSAQQQVELTVVFRAYVQFDLPRDTTSPGCVKDSPAAVIDARVPAEARAEFEKGRAALAKGNGDEAVRHLRSAVGLHPDFYEAHMLLATAHAEAGRWEDAEAALMRAADLDPRSVDALVALGEVQRRRKKYAEAERSLLAGLKLADNSWQAHLALGRVYLEQGEARRAAPHIGRTLQLKPDYPGAHLFGGNLLLKLGEPARALVEYEEYLRLDPKGEYAAEARELVQRLRKTLADKKGK
jgi:tetratricopeptide (TPR) repeat protein